MYKCLPSELIASLQACEGFNNEAFLKVHEEALPVTSVRRNAVKISEQDFVSHFQELGIALEKIPWCENGFYLSQRPVFTADPLFHAGCYYVQESSSMFIEFAFKQLLKDTNKIRILDLCAAPGGKSTLLQGHTDMDSLLVCNEVIKSRASVLEENMIKWGGANVVVTQNDPADFKRIPGFFDLMMVDAPCSGSGLFRRDPAAVVEWSESNVTLCSQRQQRILSDVLPALKEGGLLFYSTCSYSEDENEAISEWLQVEMGMERQDLNTLDEWNVVKGKGKGGGYRFWPDRVKGEGFYLACFRKTDASESFRQKQAKKISLEKITKNQVGILSPWLSDKSSDLLAFEAGENLFLFPENLNEDLKTLMGSQIYIKLAGIRLGRWASKSLIPDHALGISGLVSKEIVEFSLNKDAALKFLIREELLPDELQKNVGTVFDKDEDQAQKEIQGFQGWSLACYKSHPLGWMKVLTNRVNNYYPKEWRILKRSFD